VKPSMLWILALAGAAILLACLVLGAASSSARTLRDESAPSACTAGPHGGEITADQTWCAADSPHIVGETLTVAVGAVLTIEAGAEVRLADYAAIDAWPSPAGRRRDSCGMSRCAVAVSLIPRSVATQR
jgi:hypothetical protein